MADAPSDVYWVPLGVKRPGMIAAASCATVSLVFISALLTYVATLLLRHRRAAKSAHGRLERESRAIRFLASSHGVAFVSLLAGDLLQALGFSLTYHWLALGAVPAPAHPTALCTAQAVLIQVGDIGSAFSALIIAANLFSIICLKRTASLAALLSAIAFAWVCSGVLAGVGPAAFPPRPGRLPFYGPAGGWCWIGAGNQTERLTLHYLFVFIVALSTFLLYSAIALRIWWRRRQLGADATLSGGTTNVAKIMLIYPAVYVATILPISVYRCAAMAGHVWRIEFALAGGAVFTLSGAANCTVYALTRHIVSFDGIGEALRRGSGSGSFGRPSLDPSQHSLEPPRPSLLARLRALFHKRDDPNSSADSSPTLAGAVRIKVETDVVDPHAVGDSASPRLGEYSTVQWGAPVGGVAPRRPSVAVSPLEGRPFAQLDPVARRSRGRKSEGEKDVELGHEELKETGEIDEIEEEEESQQSARRREPA
ncbi:hypothetical protein JCM9279_007578 [Rhodotorula babjevae]